MQTCWRSAPAAPMRTTRRRRPTLYADEYVEQTPGAVVVDRAVAPADPYEPDVLRSVLLSALAGLAIGVVAALVVRWRDTTLRSERQLCKITDVPNLAVIPRHPLDEDRPDDVAVLRDPNSIESEAYRTLAHGARLRGAETARSACCW